MSWDAYLGKPPDLGMPDLDDSAIAVGVLGGADEYNLAEEYQTPAEANLYLWATAYSLPSSWQLAATRHDRAEAFSRGLFLELRRYDECQPAFRALIDRPLVAIESPVDPETVGLNITLQFSDVSLSRGLSLANNWFEYCMGYQEKPTEGVLELNEILAEDRRFILNQPLRVEWAVTDGLWEYSCASLDLFSYSDEQEEAFEIFRFAFVSCWDNIARESDANLAPRAQGHKRILMSLVKKEQRI